MPNWGDEFWGEGEWGEQSPINIGDFADLGGNDLILPAEIQFIGFDGPEADELLTDRIYNFHLESIRNSDTNLLWKRFCDGFESFWIQIENKIDEIETLWNIDKIDDKYVHHLLPQVGWTSDLKHITDKLSPSSIRRLVASAVDLWKRRGAEASSLEVLNIIIGVDAWNWNWFDRRFVLGQARFGHDQNPATGWNDAYLLSKASQRTSNLKIADPERTLDRQLIRDIVKLWRPVGERVLITYVEFWDRFEDDSKGWVTYNSEVEAETIIEDNLLKLEEESAQHAFPESTALKLLSNYMTKASVSYSGTGSWFGLSLGFSSNDFDSQLEIRIYPDSNELKLYKNEIQIGDTVDIKRSHRFILSPEVWYSLRAVVEDKSSYLALYLDNVKVFESHAMNLNDGTSGICHGAGITLNCSQFDITPIPGENDFVDIN